MGAHTLGQVDPRNSMFKYIWTRNEQAFFNNEYYHSLADDKQYVLQCKDCELIANCKECKKVSTRLAFLQPFICCFMSKIFSKYYHFLA